jgi:hypothetical protein
VVTLAACEAANDPAALNRGPAVSANAVLPGTTANGVADVEEFELCKMGSSATFDYSVFDRLTSTTRTGSLSLNDGQCVVLAVFGNVGADVTVTETSAQSGYTFDRVEVDVATGKIPSVITHLPPQTTPTVSERISGEDGVGLRGVLAVYYNVAEPPPPPEANGRMTGGGRQIDVGGVTLTRGFTVHCDITLSNNIELNWAGYRWHLDKPIDTAQCFDDPAIDQRPPNAPLDTFIGTATGRLNGVDGYKLEFTFVDAGEPGRNDKAAFKITAPDGTVVLNVPLSLLNNGNIQAHFDQPHK